MVTQTVCSLPTMQETQVRSLGWQDLLEKEIANHSSTLAWKIPWTRSLVGCSPRGSKELDTTERLHFHFLSVLTIWWFHVQSHLLCCWKRVFVMTSVFSCQNSVSFCPASFYTPRPNLPVTPSISWLPTFAFQSPMMKRTSVCVCLCVC